MVQEKNGLSQEKQCLNDLESQNLKLNKIITQILRLGKKRVLRFVCMTR